MAATVRLINPETRARAKHWIGVAEDGVSVIFTKPTRTNQQNSKLWAMLNDVSKQKELGGQKRDREYWKAVFMKACEHEVTFAIGLDGDPFPMGFRSSRLSVSQMADLITFIIQWGDEQGVVWSDEAKA
ncbi:recombination protein NinB [Ruegeria sp. HKCCD6109]|uniref:recombination protein NinB n=1 Tax=Ruegeria sp. HKCCD6109 TaxID=2683017 RepID=UPI0014925786|nr:recombination protein NinB [Ruegeria sp. HKCCD6109]NOD65777.1 hypothetical protein [Ruegeria sp. HKCCD6109]